MPGTTQHWDSDDDDDDDDDNHNNNNDDDDDNDNDDDDDGGVDDGKLNTAVAWREAGGVPRGGGGGAPPPPPPPPQPVFCPQKSKHAYIKVENNNSSPKALKQSCLCSWMKHFLVLRYREQSNGSFVPKTLCFSNTMS